MVETTDNSSKPITYTKKEERELRLLRKATGIPYETEIVAEFDNKKDAKTLKTKLIKEAKEKDPAALPLNKTKH